MSDWQVSAELAGAGMMAAFGLGMLWGMAMEAWSWRISGDSHHHSHKSGGRWWRVHPEGD